MEKIRVLISLFYRGQEVADAKKWKNHQITANQVTALVALLVVLAKAFDIKVPLTDSDTAAIGVAVFALVNWVFGVVTSRDHGLPAKPAAEPVPVEDKSAPVPAVGASDPPDPQSNIIG